jgi:3-oxoadipyl-CoA thiolase
MGRVLNRPLREAWIVSAVRTPVGRYGGALARVRPDDLAAIAIKAAVERSNVDANDIDDVILGAANQAGEDNRNVARMSALLAGLPTSVAGQTVNRLCGSGLQAINAAAHAIMVGDGDAFVAGGVESMTRAPYVMAKADAAYDRGPREMYDTTLGWRFTNPRLAEMYYPYSMGETGENVAERFGVSRSDQDAFALRSHRLAVAATEAGRLAEEIVPIEAPRGRETGLVEADEGPRPDASLEKLAKLRPVFREGGTVTAGNASTLNDGAACMLIASEKGVEELGAEPLARVVASGVAGVDPALMGIGPVKAVPKALENAGLTLDQIDLVELNEAFASQVLASARELGIEEERLNVNGGAIALGHPLGCSGARLTGTLVRELKRRGGRYGVVTLCVGVGQGSSTVFEAV